MRPLPLSVPILVLALAACSAEPANQAAPVNAEGRTEVQTPPPPPPEAQSQGPVANARVRLAAVRGNPSGGYFTLIGGAGPDRLTGISSPKAASIQMHEMRMENGMMKMAEIEGIDIPAQGKVEFAPGGLHAMLFGLAPDVKAGGTLPLTFHFDKGGPVTIDAAVIAAGDGMGGMAHSGAGSRQD